MKILVVDDHPLFIDGISQVLKRLSSCVVITKVMTVADAIVQIDSGKEFDLILLDLNIPELDGNTLLHRYRSDELCIPLVIVSSEEKAGLIRNCLNWGAMGFIPKSYGAEEMLTAIRHILEGNIYIPEFVNELINRLPKEERSNKLPDLLRKNGISKKQYAVLELLANGHSNQQISTILNRTEHTVKSHISALLQILNVKNRIECIKVAKSRNLLDQ
ncbi:MAG: response regulator transcription factor [Gammaproteobacteria bacterium]|nr:response regulator transcription factor [Gammaproteobacteria bacterium]